MDMVLNNIERLIEKYEAGETSLQEEQQLKAYFSQELIEPHLEIYKPMFNYFSQTQNERFTKEIPFRRDRSHLYKLVSIAAIVLIMLGVVFDPIGFSDPTEQEQREAEIAYNQTMEALNLVSNQLNGGKEIISPLNTLNTNLTEGMHKANLINEFSETTSIIYNTSNN